MPNINKTTILSVIIATGLYEFVARPLLNKFVG